MVLPIIGGAAVLGFIAFGKEIFGVKLFKQIAMTGAVIGVAVIGYFVYKLYKTGEDAKQTGEDIKKFFTDKYDWVTGGAGKESKKVLDKYDPEDRLEGISEDVVLSGEWITQLLGGSAITAGHDTAQETYNHFESKYGIHTAEEYASLPAADRAAITLGDWITGGKATDLGVKTGEGFTSTKIAIESEKSKIAYELEALKNKLKFW